MNLAIIVEKKNLTSSPNSGYVLFYCNVTLIIAIGF